MNPEKKINLPVIRYLKMKTKLKLLFLALLGLILIPNTYAYELSEIRNWSESWAPPTTTRHRGMCLHYNRDWYMTFDGQGYSYADISRDNTSCSEWAVLGNFFAPRDYNSPWYEQIYNDYFSYVNSKQNGEWMDMIRTVYQNWEHKTVITTLPSRTAYKRTSNAGIDYMFTQIYFYHNQFILYDPVKEVGLSFLGKMNVVGGAVFANPWVLEDNLRFIDYVRKKAYSATITNTAAWKWLLWTDVSMSRLQSMNWSKSYTMNKGGSSFLPPNFKINKQGSEWFQYIEDIEFTAPDWNAGKPNNQQTGDNQGLAEYNACYSYYSAIKHYTSYDYNCYKTLLDSAPLTGQSDLNQLLKPWNDIQTWDWEWNIAIQTKNIACHTLIKLKKEYKQQYKEKRGEFLKISSENFFYPHSMDIKGYCGERPKVDKVEWWLIQSMKNWFEWFRDRFDWNSGDPITVYSGKNYYKFDYNSALADLNVEYSHCKGMWKFRELIVDKDTIESGKKRACERYELKKKEFNKIFWWLKWVVNSAWAIQKIEDWNASSFGRIKKFVNVITDPYYSGFNSVNLVPALCSGPKNDFFNIFFYLFFFGVVLYLFKIFT